MRVVLAPSARSDLADIWSHIASENQSAADHLIEQIGAALERLSLFPLSGRRRDELVSGLRSYFVRPRFTVFYRIVEDRLEVAHILHHARNLSAFFTQDQLPD